jgi:hypothetical protein
MERSGHLPKPVRVLTGSCQSRARWLRVRFSAVDPGGLGVVGVQHPGLVDEQLLELPGRLLHPSRWARLMPHLLAADLTTTDNPALRRLAYRASRYLLLRGRPGALTRAFGLERAEGIEPS